ncbi:MAG: hypothetical protein ACAH59_13800 [Pseudobdellovibrionaceae bacterium]
MEQNPNRTILILKSASDQLADIEIFLKSRGFQITIVNETRQAMREIMEKRPAYAFLSANLLPQSCTWLFGVLNQITSVILFVNRISAKNLAITRDLNGAYLLEPPLTPLGMDQILRRIEKDNQKQTLLTSKLNETHLQILSLLSEASLKAHSHPRIQGAAAERIQRIQRVTCFRVQTPVYAGCFVIAYGKSRLLEDGWIQNLQTEMKKSLDLFHDHLEMSKAEEITIQEIRFNNWTKEQSDFMLQAVHLNSEIAMAFFKDPSPLDIKNSSHKGYVELKLDQIPGNLPTSFDVYIYLPQNAHFILYNRKGSVLTEQRKNNLIADGIQSVLITRRSFLEIQKQRTQQFIEQSSLAYQAPR